MARDMLKGAVYGFGMGAMMGSAIGLGGGMKNLIKKINKNP